MSTTTNLIKPEDNPTIVTVYSKNDCTMCRMTKNVLAKEGIEYQEVNIEESGQFEDYVDFLKTRYQKAQMPFVIPAEGSGLDPWTGFQPAKIKQLA